MDGEWKSCAVCKHVCLKYSMRYIVFDKKKSPIKEIWMNKYKNTVKISCEDLHDILFDLSGNYKSREARMIDEQIFFFVSESMVINCKEEEIEQYIYESI